MQQSIRLVLAIVLALVFAFVQHTQAKTWVVDAGGTGNFTSLGGVYSNVVKPGDIIYMRGTFTSVQRLQGINGTKDQPITITSYPGTRAIVDGTSFNPGDNQGLVQINVCHFIILDNILIRNSKEGGLSIYLSSNLLIQNSEIHDVQKRGLGGCSNDVVIRNNTVYNACMNNEDGKSVTGWMQAISSSSCSSVSEPVKNWVMEYNKVFNSWCEGIDCIQVSGCVVRHNVVHDTYSVNIYMDNANGVVVDSNFVYASNPRYYYHAPTGDSWPPSGIVVGAEQWPLVPKPSYNVTIKNNLLVGTYGITNLVNNKALWVNNVKIYYNTLWNPNTTRISPFRWPSQSSVEPSGNEFRNNLVWTHSAGACMSQKKGWTISNNVWVGVKTIPTNCTDTSATTTSLPVNLTQINFAGGKIPSIGSPLTDFYLGASSPARGAGVALASVLTDYNGYKRASNPSVGFLEYGSQANSSNSGDDSGSGGGGGDGDDGGNSSANNMASFFLEAVRAARTALIMA